jgi:cyclic beta-1,2-glucan synthetase
MSDAIVRTLTRLALTRRHLLEWTTAEQAMASPRLDYRGFYRQMAVGTALGCSMMAAVITFAPHSWPLGLFLSLLWLAAPALALLVSRSPAVARRLTVSKQDAYHLRLTARRTWRYFETFVVASENMLPPDNVQDNPTLLVARRTSPTNMGLYLLSAVAARDFGWAGTTEIIERLEATLKSMQKLKRHRGHFFNWYGTLDRTVLEPAYVSSVDSGNLASHLLVLANACEEWVTAGPARNVRIGMLDHLALASEALDTLRGAVGAQGHPLAVCFEDIGALLASSQTIESLLPSLKRLSGQAAGAARDMAPVVANQGTDDLRFWIEAFSRCVTEHERDRQLSTASAQRLDERAIALAAEARALALAMNFTFLLEPERKLLSIGFSLADNRLDSSCYDLLASEARLASLFAVAKSRKSPARIATMLFHRAFTLGTPRRVSASSITSSWYSEPRCTSSTATAPVTTSSVDGAGAPAPHEAA